MQVSLPKSYFAAQVCNCIQGIRPFILRRRQSMDSRSPGSAGYPLLCNSGL